MTRHGITKWNVEGRFQGQKNSPLTAEGIEGALLLKDILKDIPFSICYCSPLPRAIHTAELLIGDKNIPLSITMDLCEINLGNWEGQFVDEIKEKFPENFNHFRNRDGKYIPTGNGENIAEVWKRSEQFIRRIETEKQHQYILIVSHGFTIQNLLTICNGQPISELQHCPKIEQATPFYFHLDGKNWIYKKQTM